MESNFRIALIALLTSCSLFPGDSSYPRGFSSEDASYPERFSPTPITSPEQRLKILSEPMLRGVKETGTVLADDRVTDVEELQSEKITLPSFRVTIRKPRIEEKKVVSIYVPLKGANGQERLPSEVGDAS